MNILVVDDDALQLETLRRGLKNKGYQVLEALSGKEAVKCFARSNMAKIDLVLSDYLMPGMNGIELVKKIRQNYGSLPVILMTAYGEKELVIEALRNRCDSFIEKPFTLDQLMQEIERVT
ncbi:MAG: response regulator [Methanomassiliicoccales archaeon]|nr:MAG: response regulator [Methanomassiliicoccales archaeon]